MAPNNEIVFYKVDTLVTNKEVMETDTRLSRGWNVPKSESNGQITFKTVYSYRIQRPVGPNESITMPLDL